MDLQTFLQQFVNALSLGSLYALIAIGPLFVDRDFSITWSSIARHVLKLFLLLLITPAIVLTTYLVAKLFTPFSVIVAVFAEPTVCTTLAFANAVPRFGVIATEMTMAEMSVAESTYTIRPETV